MRDNLHRILEAMLFASDAPLTQQKCKELISATGIKEIREAVNYLNQQYESGGSALKIIEIAGGYLMVTREEYAPFLQKLYKGRSSARLTHARPRTGVMHVSAVARPPVQPGRAGVEPEDAGEGEGPGGRSGVHGHRGRGGTDRQA